MGKWTGTKLAADKRRLMSSRKHNVHKGGDRTHVIPTRASPHQTFALLPTSTGTALPIGNVIATSPMVLASAKKQGGLSGGPPPGYILSGAYELPQTPRPTANSGVNKQVQGGYRHNRGTSYDQAHAVLRGRRRAPMQQQLLEAAIVHPVAPIYTNLVHAYYIPAPSTSQCVPTSNDNTSMPLETHPVGHPNNPGAGLLLQTTGAADVVVDRRGQFVPYQGSTSVGAQFHGHHQHMDYPYPSRRNAPTFIYQPTGVSRNVLPEHLGVQTDHHHVNVGPEEAEMSHQSYVSPVFNKHMLIDYTLPRLF